MIIQIQKVFSCSTKTRAEKNLSQAIIAKALGIQNTEKVLKVSRQKHQVIYKGKPTRITADFLTEIFKARRVWNEVFQDLKKELPI
jgi:hypothetical protein